jgi:calcium/proton exchanger cax
MLIEGHLKLVKASLLGSIYVNLLFILGLAIMSAGIRHKEQAYDQRRTQVLVLFMAVGLICLLFPVSCSLLLLPLPIR